MLEPSGWGGIALYTHALCSALVEQGVEVRLLNNMHRDDLIHLNRGYEVIPVVQGDAWRDEWKRLRQQIDTWKPDVFHMQALISSRRDVLAFLRHRMFDDQVRYVVTAHNILPHEAALFEETAYRWLYRLSDGVIIHSQASQKKLERLAPSLPTPTSVIHHGHYGLLFENTAVNREEALVSLGLSEGRYIVCFGVIRPYKGVDWLLRSVASIKDWPADLKVLVAGKPMAGVTDESLETLRSELGLEDRVVLRLQYFDEAAIPTVFEVSDLMAFPYREIDQSGVMLAALAAGKAVLCTPVGAFPEMIDESIGFVAGHSDQDSFSSALSKALEMQESWKEMGEKALTIANSRFAWGSAAAETKQFYQMLCYGK
ncbi:glycosyltransferase [Pseudomonadota bacterium]